MSTGYWFAKVSYLLFPLVFLVLTGCTMGAESVQLDEFKTPKPDKATVRSTETVTATATSQPTDISVQSTAAITPTAHVLLGTPTAMPTATLRSEQKAANLAELMETNGGCELPCWWGIVLESTKFESARESLRAKGFQFGEDNHARMRVSDLVVSAGFDIKEDVIRSVDVGSSRLPEGDDSSAFTRSWRRYSLEAILKRHGLPTRVLVYSPFRADPGSGPGYHLLVFYEHLGIEIEYTGSAEQVNGYQYRACPDLADIWQIRLFLYQPDRVDDVVERVLPTESVSYIAGPDIVYEQISWEQATGSSLQYFYDTFSNPDSEACFDFSTS